MKKIYLKIGAWVSTLPILLLPISTYAQLSESQTQLDKVKDGIGTDAFVPLPELIGNFIRVFLGVLGIIFVVMVVYAGYLWMTDMGAGDKVKKAKGLLGTAIVGLVITIAAYAITAFVLESVIDASSGLK